MDKDYVIRRFADDGAGGLIYKSRDDAHVMRSPQPQQSDPWAGWNNWCDARIEAMFETLFTPAIAEFASEYVTKRLNAKMAKLHGQIANLKVEVAALQSEVMTLRSADTIVSGKNKCRLILPNG